jgi:hypothetical protein
MWDVCCRKSENPLAEGENRAFSHDFDGFQDPKNF